MADIINYKRTKNPFEGDGRRQENLRIREFISSAAFSRTPQDLSEIIDLAFQIIALNNEVNLDSIISKDVIDYISGDVVSPPLFPEELTLEDVKEHAHALLEQLTPDTDEKKAIFMYLYFAKGHFGPDSNGRTSRIISAVLLNQPESRLLKLVNKNPELKKWLTELNDFQSDDPYNRFQKLYREATNDCNIKEFIRIIRGESAIDFSALRAASENRRKNRISNKESTE